MSTEISCEDLAALNDALDISIAQNNAAAFETFMETIETTIEKDFPHRKDVLSLAADLSRFVFQYHGGMTATKLLKECDPSRHYQPNVWSGRRRIVKRWVDLDEELNRFPEFCSRCDSGVLTEVQISKFKDYMGEWLIREKKRIHFC